MAINISEQELTRANETNSKYNQLTGKIVNIDEAYSAVPQDVVLDLPDSLNQEKLTYTSPTDEEMYQQAFENTLSDYLTKKYNLTASSDKKSTAIDSQIKSVESTLDKAIDKLGDSRDKSQESALDNSVRKGMARSTIAEGVKQLTQDNYDQSVEEVRDNTNGAIQILQQSLEQLAQNTAAAIDNLDDARDADIKVKLTKILESVQSQIDNVTRYNNTVEEKEQKYVSGREVTLANHKEKENKRAMNAAELRAKIGNTAFKEMIIEEKEILVKSYIAGMTKQEANAFINTDNSLRNLLGNSFVNIQNFINSMP